MNKKIDVIIPSYKPDKKYLQLMKMLQKQTYPIHRIIVLNTEEKFYERLLFGTGFGERNKNVEVYHHSKKEFDHGMTRNKGVKRSDAELFVFMTQDAVPANEFMIEELVKAVSVENVAVAYARQLADEDCNPIEQYTRIFNYPEESRVKSAKDLEELGIKTFFCSNVCAIYRRDIFDNLGGFINRTIFNEDMIYAAKAIQAGYAVAYAAKAHVIHSHNYSAKEQFHRNFDIGVSHADYPEVFQAYPAESEGIKMVKQTADYLKRTGKRNLIPVLVVRSGCKFLGYKLGVHYKRLPKKMIISLSMNKDYWRLHSLKKEVSGIDATKGYGKTEAEMKK